MTNFNKETTAKFLIFFIFIISFIFLSYLNFSFNNIIIKKIRTCLLKLNLGIQLEKQLDN